MIMCVPWASADVEHVAVPELSGTAAQPIAPPLSVKLTVPVGALPVTVAENTTSAPAVDGLGELANDVVVVTEPPPPPVMVSTSELLDDALPASPA